MPPPSPSELEQQVRIAITAQVGAAAQAIRIQVVDRRVTLSGTASDWRLRELVMRAAWSVPAVLHIVDNVTVVRRSA